MPREQALYVLVRGDLSKSSQAVQAGHAVAQFVLHKTSQWKNGTLVYLKAPNEEYLEGVLRETETEQVVEFREPDLGNSLTAVAILGPEDMGHSAFPMLRLL